MTARHARLLRLVALSVLLGSLFFALWYDYQVARPAVDHAYAEVSALNARINAAASPQPMTVSDVRRVLGGKLPSATYTEGPYQVEVYSWTGGLPFRSHEYYVVYLGRGQNMAVTRHYKFFLPLDELRSPTANHDLPSAEAERNPPEV